MFKTNWMMVVSILCMCYAIIALELDHLTKSDLYTMPILGFGYFIGLCSCIIQSFSSVSIPRPIEISWLYAFVIILSILIFPNEELTINNIIKNTSWIVMFYMGYLWSQRKFGTKFAFRIILYFVIPLSFYLNFRILSNTEIGGFDHSYRDAIFTIAVLSPFSLFVKRKPLRITLIIISLILILLSAKRSVIIGSFVGIIAYTAKLFKDDKQKGRVTLIVLTLILIGIIIFPLMNLNLEIFSYTISRFDESSNGRDTILSDILASFGKSDILQQLFGHGSLSTMSITGKGAHNDFVEVLYDYGLVAVIIFIWLYVLLFIKGIKAYFGTNRNVEMAAIYLYNLSIFITLGMFNCFISSPRTFSITMFIFGFLLGTNTLGEKGTYNVNYIRQIES